MLPYRDVSAAVISRVGVCPCIEQRPHRVRVPPLDSREERNIAPLLSRHTVSQPDRQAYQHEQQGQQQQPAALSVSSVMKSNGLCNHGCWSGEVP